MITGIIGHTGSGKSTLVRLFNGLEKPESGRVLLDGTDIWEKPREIGKVRFRVGLVMQYPEYQLFEETVAADIAFGPRNMGLGEDEIKKRVLSAVRAVGLSEDILESSPFELSGGQKRKVAVAGVLALKPKILFMDEPIAGLDPISREQLMDMTVRLNKSGVTIIMISHNMEGVAEYASRVIAVREGKILADGTPKEVFSQHETLKSAGLEMPFCAQLVYELNKRGAALPEELIKYDETLNALTEKWGERR